MHAPTYPSLRAPAPRRRVLRSVSSSDEFSILSAIVDPSWIDSEASTELSVWDEFWSPPLSAADLFEAEEETQIDLDVGGAVSALLARVCPPRRASSISRLDEDWLAGLDEPPQSGSWLREPTESAELLVLAEGPTEQLDVDAPLIEVVEDGLSADGLEWLDPEFLVEL